MIFVRTSIKFIFAKIFQQHGNNIRFMENGMEIQQEVLIQLNQNQMKKTKKLKIKLKIQTINGLIILNLEYLLLKKTTLIISLMQEDEKISKRPYIPVNFLVIRVKSKRDRLWEINKSDILLEASEGSQRFA